MEEAFELVVIIVGAILLIMLLTEMGILDGPDFDTAERLFEEVREPERGPRPFDDRLVVPKENAAPYCPPGWILHNEPGEVCTCEDPAARVATACRYR